MNIKISHARTLTVFSSKSRMIHIVDLIENDLIREFLRFNNTAFKVRMGRE